MTAPTPQDIRNAETRQAIADRQNQEYGEAMKLAIGTLGPEWKPWMKLVLLDSDHRKTGNTKPVAVAYKVYRGEEKRSDNAVYLRRMPDGTVKLGDRYEEIFGELLHEPHPTKTLEFKGQQVPAPRYELCWSALELYSPQSAEQLADARERRQAKVVEKEAEGSLFADQIRAEGFVPKKRGR